MKRLSIDPGAFYKATEGLAPRYMGAYVTLLLEYDRRGAPLPATPKRLASIVRWDREDLTGLERLLEEFFERTPRGWVPKQEGGVSYA